MSSNSDLQKLKSPVPSRQLKSQWAALKSEVSVSLTKQALCYAMSHSAWAICVLAVSLWFTQDQQTLLAWVRSTKARKKGPGFFICIKVRRCILSAQRKHLRHLERRAGAKQVEVSVINFPTAGFALSLHVCAAVFTLVSSQNKSLHMRNWRTDT